MTKLAVLFAADRASAAALVRAQKGELVAVYDGSTRDAIERVTLAAHEGRFEILPLAGRSETWFGGWRARTGGVLHGSTESC
jgi:hypothetical protein